MNPVIKILCATSCLLLFLLQTGCDQATKAPEKLRYEILSTAPHDANAYTQGLQFDGKRLLESTGQYGDSTVRDVDAKTGDVLKKRPLSFKVFGEGITIHNNELWVLTWKENTAYVLDKTSFALLREYHFQGEGWGLASDGKNLIMSDGSSNLKWINPADFTVIKSMPIINQGNPVTMLNELEFVDGKIYANIYMTDRIVQIDAAKGNVTGTLDCGGLRSKLPYPNRAEAFNGIAHDPATGHFFVTGKYWPKMFELKLLETKE